MLTRLTLILVPILFAVLSCGGNKELLQANRPEENPIQIDLKGLSEPNRYTATLSWPMKPSATKWILSRKEIPIVRGATSGPMPEQIQLAVLEAGETSFEDKTVRTGFEYTYYVNAIIGEVSTWIGEATSRVFPDVDLSGEISNPEDLVNAGRVFLRGGTRLLTGTRGLKIQARELISDSATIESFPEEARAILPNNGRNAGPITISVEEAQGTLVIRNRGENGANGADGGQGGQGAPGSKGSRAILRPGKGSNQKVVSPEMAELVRLADSTCGLLTPQTWVYCHSHPTDGSPGGTGAAGSAGGPGTNGGNSGRVLVEVRSDSLAFFDISNDAGRPGEGGRGGLGGPGGYGGLPGDLDVLEICNPAKQGAFGPTGPFGPNGPLGKTGLRAPYCVSVAESKSGDCRLF